MKFFGVRGFLEVRIGLGYVDLVLRDFFGRKIIVEFKCFFEFRRNKFLRIDLNWKEYEE